MPGQHVLELVSGGRNIVQMWSNVDLPSDKAAVRTQTRCTIGYTRNLPARTPAKCSATRDLLAGAAACLTIPPPLNIATTRPRAVRPCSHQPHLTSLSRSQRRPAAAEQARHRDGATSVCRQAVRPAGGGRRAGAEPAHDPDQEAEPISSCAGTPFMAVFTSKVGR